MKNILIIALLQLFAFISIGQNVNTNIDSSFEKLITEYGNIGVSSAYSSNGKTVWKSSQGYANRDLKTSFTDTTLTRIASIAKPMTAICIMQLVENGKLALDDEVQTYIKDYPRKSKKVMTIRHLLTHSSGIKGYKKSKEATSQKEYPTLTEVSKVFRNRKLKFDPGSGFLYTSYGYVLLGLIIEEVSGLTYEEYLRKNILEVAGMKNTAVEVFGKVYENKSVIYHMDNRKVKTPKQNNLSNRIPAGGLYSTVADLMKFGDAVLNHKLISENSFNQMQEVGFPINYPSEGNPYGLGWSLYGPKDNFNAYIGHEGGQYGGNTQLMLIPKLKSTIVVLSNTSGTPDSNIKLFAVKILEKILIAYNEEKANK